MPSMENLRKTISLKFPNLYKSLRKGRYAIWQRRIAFNYGLKSGAKRNDLHRIIWVDPICIKKVGVGWGRYNKFNEFGKIVSGNWDLNTMPFEDLDIYRAFYERFVHGRDWKETNYYRDYIYQTERAKNIGGVNDKKDIPDKFGEFDKLFEKIKFEGFSTQIDLKETDTQISAMDEITVRIGRDGELLFEDGRHRLAIAKILGIKKIPVRVTWRHKNWYVFRLQILDYAKHKNDGKVYQPLTHPDLSDIPSSHGESRYEIIRANIDLNGGTMLDIGANWGYFCHKFEKKGFQCYAVEHSAKDFYFLNRLRLAENRTFAAIHADIFDFHEKGDFEVVLALNIFHHFLKTRETYETLINFLQRIKTRIMFFEAHLPYEDQMEGAYRNFNNEEFVKFISENAGLKRWKKIGVVEGNRPIYKLWK